MGDLRQPVNLYVKTHRLTGLKYFGRTVENPFEYRGSGAYWTRHLEKYGNDVSTKIIGTYTNSAELRAAAESFSADHDVATSVKWANLLPEDGNVTGDGWSPYGDHAEQIAALDAAVQRELQARQSGSASRAASPPAPIESSSGRNPLVWVAVAAGVIGALWFFNQSSQPSSPTSQTRTASCSDLLKTAVETERADRWVEPNASEFMGIFSKRCNREYSIWVDWQSIWNSPGSVLKCSEFYQWRVEPEAIVLARQDGSCSG